MPPTRLKQGLGVALVLAVTSAAAAGCGGSDSNPFVGTWMITQASATVTCTGNPPFTAAPTGNVEFALGTTSAIVAVSPSELDPNSFCDFKFDVSGATAKIQTGQTCTLVAFSLAPFAATITPDMTWTFSLTGPNAAEETGAAAMQLPTVDANNNPTGVIACTYTAHKATLTRVARN